MTPSGVIFFSFFFVCVHQLGTCILLTMRSLHAFAQQAGHKGKTEFNMLDPFTNIGMTEQCDCIRLQHTIKCPNAGNTHKQQVHSRGHTPMRL